jgi:hypothetical protein
MSGILARVKKQTAEGDKKLFAAVCAPRLVGKTTLAGTLPGKTLLLQVAVLESGCKSAQALAEQLGNDLTVLSVATLDEWEAIIDELSKDKEFDNVYVDGLTAINEVIFRDPKTQALKNRDSFKGYALIGETTDGILTELKRLTYQADNAKAKNVFVTVALKVESDNGVNDVKLEVKGKVSVTSITKLAEAVLTVVPPVKTESGTTPHTLLTKSDGVWPGRVDGLLESQNPGVVSPANLTTFLNLLNGGSAA